MNLGAPLILQSASIWWCRSAYYNIAYGFCFVSTDGSAYYCYSRLSYGLAPAFLNIVRRTFIRRYKKGEVFPRYIAENC